MFNAIETKCCYRNERKEVDWSIDNFLSRMEKRIFEGIDKGFSINAFIGDFFDYFGKTERDYRVAVQEKYFQILQLRRNMLKARLEIVGLLKKYAEDCDGFDAALDSFLSEKDKKWLKKSEEEKDCLNKREVETVREVFRQFIVDNYCPNENNNVEVIVIFGSMAKFKQNPRSDIDLFYIVSNQYDIDWEKYWLGVAGWDQDLKKRLQEKEIGREIESCHAIGVGELHLLRNFVEKNEKYLVIGGQEKIEKVFNEFIVEAKNYEEASVADKNDCGVIELLRKD